MMNQIERKSNEGLISFGYSQKDSIILRNCQYMNNCLTSQKIVDIILILLFPW